MGGYCYALQHDGWLHSLLVVCVFYWAALPIGGLHDLLAGCISLLLLCVSYDWWAALPTGLCSLLTWPTVRFHGLLAGCMA